LPTRPQRGLLFLPLIMLLVPFLFWPAVFGLLSSFTTYAPAEGHARFVGLYNYATVLGDLDLRLAFRNVALLLGTAVPAELIIGIAVAYTLRTPFPGRGLLRMCLLVPWLLSPIAAGVMWHFLYGRAGLLDWILAWLGLPPQPSPLGVPGHALPAVIVVEIWRKAPLVSFLLLPGLLAVPAAHWEQAVLDGASLAMQLRHIMLPWVRPLLLTIALLLVGDTLSTFDSTLMMTGGGPGSETLTPALYSFQHAYKIYNWPFAVTSAWIVVGMMLLVGLGYVFLLRAEEEM
jgi:multiple sugar transport system permease protein